jgi:pancreatic triacylglycerol lipase
MRSIKNQFSLLTAFSSGLPLEQEPNLVLIPDGNGQLILVDLNTYEIDESTEPRFNALADIVFLLYTRSNPTTPQTLRIQDLASVTNSNFNRNHPTRYESTSFFLMF